MRHLLRVGSLCVFASAAGAHAAALDDTATPGIQPLPQVEYPAEFRYLTEPDVATVCALRLNTLVLKGLLAPGAGDRNHVKHLVRAQLLFEVWSARADVDAPSEKRISELARTLSAEAKEGPGELQAQYCVATGLTAYSTLTLLRQQELQTQAVERLAQLAAQLAKASKSRPPAALANPA